MNSIEITYLLGSYLIISDNEIDKKELNVLHNFSIPTKEIIIKSQQIFSDDVKNFEYSLETLSLKAKQKFNNNEKQVLFKLLLNIAYADGFYHPNEKDFIDNLTKELSFSLNNLHNIENEILNTHQLYIEPVLSWIDSLKDRFYALLYEIDDNSEKKYEGKLLSGNTFAKKIKSLASKANEDLELTTLLMEDLNYLLNDKIKEIRNSISDINKYNRNDDVSNEVLDKVKSISNTFEEIFFKELNNNQTLLKKKQQTINYFTIAFMGRTKAGKSTFHKVITDEEVDDIGIGKLRTTRYNRSFTWENIRIIDTPGIGAPGGKSDAETAKSIIDEADLVCYLVTNDSIQETEFDFLKDLKEKNKPLFIILNIKEDLEHPSRFSRFLKNPLKWKEDAGNKSIQGHFDRIKDCIGDKYDYSAIEIIPIQLLAAKILSDRKNNLSSDEINALSKGANLDEYVHKIKTTIFKTGHIKKTQNIVDGCNFYVDKLIKETKTWLEELYSLNSMLNKQKN